MKFASLAKQVFVALGRWLDFHFGLLLERDGLQALKGTTVPQVSLDPHMSDIVAMGGADGDEAHGVVNVPAHVRSAATFSNMRKFDLNRRWTSILTRYWFAGRQQYSDTKKLAIVYDGSRFQFDSMFGMVGAARSSHEDFVTMVLPPQAVWAAFANDVS